ncbi:HD domain-containing protein [Alteribacillus sp. HJP-4]|uniref:HD domain-containing protein n=1 Tax=Alteribacillus sp. HJP-4 TaxID=2775394 RepID=UPI0035CD278E
MEYLKNDKYILQQAKTEAHRFFQNTDPAHDFWHSHRVAVWSVRLAEEEGADRFICELAAWLHDIADSKLNETEHAGQANVKNWLDQHVENSHKRDHVMDIIKTMSWRKGSNPPMNTLEGRIVQDADRLDAIGAIGIARAFAYSGSHGKPLHEPAAEDKDNRDTAIQHFFDKLFLLKSLMNTETAKKVANQRQKYMISYLEQFYSEWEGKL